MNIKSILLLLITIGCALPLTSCKKQQTVIVEKERISGPLSDDSIAWEESDLK